MRKTTSKTEMRTLSESAYKAFIESGKTVTVVPTKKTSGISSKRWREIVRGESPAATPHAYTHNPVNGESHA